MKEITINILPLLKAAEKTLPKTVKVEKKTLKRLAKKEAKILKEHFATRNPWPIRADEYSAQVLYPIFKMHINDYINWLILKELGPGFTLGFTKNSQGKEVYAFQKNKGKK